VIPAFNPVTPYQSGEAGFGFAAFILRGAGLNLSRFILKKMPNNVTSITGTNPPSPHFQVRFFFVIDIEYLNKRDNFSAAR